jgi:AraC-like DNA-binding protein
MPDIDLRYRGILLYHCRLPARGDLPLVPFAGNRAGQHWTARDFTPAGTFSIYPSRLTVQRSGNSRINTAVVVYNELTVVARNPARRDVWYAHSEGRVLLYHLRLIMLHKNVVIRLCEARALLRDTCESRRSIRQIARETGMSVFHFIRLYKGVFGETPKQCQLGARLEHAKHLLMATNFPVTDISLDAGFASLGTFSHVFTRRIGTTPTGYRYKMRSMARVPGETPSELVPGCFSLMGGPAHQIRNF